VLTAEQSGQVNEAVALIVRLEQSLQRVTTKKALAEITDELQGVVLAAGLRVERSERERARVEGANAVRLKSWTAWPATPADVFHSALPNPVGS
jgi:hypothetical protein